MKALLCFSLFAIGYLMGTAQTPLQAQSSYWYGSDGSSGSAHQMIPGGPTYYYGNNGQSGVVIPDTTLPPASSYGRNPC